MKMPIFFTALIMAMQLMAGEKPAIGGMKDFDYVNQSTNIVTISVPYFAKTNDATRLMPIALEPGDAYFRGSIAKRQNGSLHKRYGLMPDLASPALKDIPVWTKYGNYHECETRMYVVNDVLVRNNMRFYNDYIESSKREQKSAFDAFNTCIKNINLEVERHNDNSDYIKSSQYQKLIDARNYFSIVTNTPVNALESIYDMDADSDGDGLSNKEEFELDTSALVRNRIVLSPYLLEVKSIDHGTTTNYFTLRNLSDEDWNCGLGFADNYEYLPWNPRIVAVDGTELQLDNTRGMVNLYCKLFVKARSSVKLALLCDAETLPADFLGSCNIGVVLYLKSFSKEENCATLKGINVFISSGRQPDVVSPATEIPETGSHFVNEGSATNIVFTWGDSSCKVNEEYSDNSKLLDLLKKSANWYSQHKYVEESCRNKNYRLWIYKIKDRNQLDKIIDIRPGTSFAFIRPSGFDTGIYVWRVSKIDCMGYPVASDWSWFSVGEEIRPEMAVTADDKTTVPSQPSK